MVVAVVSLGDVGVFDSAWRCRMIGYIPEHQKTTSRRSVLGKASRKSSGVVSWTFVSREASRFVSCIVSGPMEQIAQGLPVGIDRSAPRPVDR